MAEQSSVAHGNMHPLATEFYDVLIRQEQEPPDPNEHLVVSGITPDSVESGQLTALGISESQIRAGDFTRAQLLEAGFVFMNRLGGGEKALISGSFPATADAPLLDTHRRVLLTGDELARIGAHQRAARTEAGLGDIDIESTRLGMLNFLLQALDAKETQGEEADRLFRQAQGYLVETAAQKTAAQKDLDAVYEYFDKEKIIYFDKDKEKIIVSTWIYDFLRDHCLAGLDQLYVQDVPIEMFKTRMSALEGAPSPYLESGFRFSLNPDVTLYPNDHAKTRRLNMASIHLLSRGLDEEGSSVNGSHDQTYVTAAEFQQILDDAKTSGTALSSPEKVKLVAARLVAAAREPS